MIQKLDIKRTIKYFFILTICLFIFFSQSNSKKLFANTMDQYKDELVVEELRLKVPSKFKDVWLKAEKNIWEPWLSIQDGFLGRQIFWNEEKEVALILVNWKNKELWKRISINEVNEIQKKFEDNVKTTLNVRKNPFELIYEGELDKQG